MFLKTHKKNIHRRTFDFWCLMMFDHFVSRNIYYCQDWWLNHYALLFRDFIMRKRHVTFVFASRDIFRRETNQRFEFLKFLFHKSMKIWLTNEFFTVFSSFRHSFARKITAVLIMLLLVRLTTSIVVSTVLLC